MKRDRILALLLSLALLCGVAGAGVYALAGEKEQEDSQDVQTEAPAEEKSNTQGLSKDETVYVITGADGSVEKLIVSDWIKNPSGAASITESAALSDVESVKGDAEYTIRSDGARVWETKGGDIYCQGSSSQPLPVEVKVSYQLDGKSITPEELAGKSGHVTIRFDYKNQQYEMAEINGKQEKIYVPFAMLTGLVLDGEHFSDVSVSNGKLLNDGDRIAVIGLAFPGLNEDLGLSGEVELPEYVEIEADTQEFTLATAVTIASNSVFSNVDTQDLKEKGGLSKIFRQVTDAIGQFSDGTSQLYDGLCTLLDKSGDLISGVDRLAQGAQQLQQGAGTLAQGAGQLKTGADSLESGLGTLVQNNDTLNAGARQVFETLLAEANKQLKAADVGAETLTVENYASVLNGLLAELDGVGDYAEKVALEKVTAAVKTYEPMIRQQVTQAVEQQAWAGVLQANGMTPEQYEAAVKAGLIDQATQTALENALAGVMKQQEAVIEQEVQNQLQNQIQQQMASSSVQSQINSAKDEAAAGMTSIRALKQQLDSYNQFYTGLAAYTAGVSQAAEGSKELSSGAGQLQSGAQALSQGAEELYQGILTLKDGSAALVEGVSRLKDGAMQLNDGLKSFQNQGSDALLQSLGGENGALSARLKAAMEAAEHYNSFSGLEDGMDGQVKFIYRMAAIEEKEQ